MPKQIIENVGTQYGLPDSRRLRNVLRHHVSIKHLCPASTQMPRLPQLAKTRTRGLPQIPGRNRI